MTEESKVQMIRVLQAALIELNRAASVLDKETVPAACSVRPRVFEIAPGITWPYIEHGRVFWYLVRYYTEHNEVSWTDVNNAAYKVACAAQWKPRGVLRALRRIQAATAWCQARIEGRQRAAEELLRQQKRALDTLQAEVALINLGK